MSTHALLDAAKKLDPLERIQLMNDIWETLYQEDAALTLTPEQEAVLDERVARIERDGVQGEEWSVVLERLMAERRK